LDSLCKFQISLEPEVELKQPFARMIVDDLRSRIQVDCDGILFPMSRNNNNSLDFIVEFVILVEFLEELSLSSLRIQSLTDKSMRDKNARKSNLSCHFRVS